MLGDPWSGSVKSDPPLRFPFLRGHQAFANLIDVVNDRVPLSPHGGCAERTLISRFVTDR